MPKPSDYEHKAIKEIHNWKNPESNLAKKFLKIINWPADKAGRLILDTPGIGWVIEKSIEGIVSVATDLAHSTVRHNEIIKDFHKRGHTSINHCSDVFCLDLENIDLVIGWLAAKYKGLTFTSGAATGFTGLPGIPPDIIALVTLNLRAIGEYATYCGFDINSQEERIFAMSILGRASDPRDSTKIFAMEELGKIAQDVARRKTWKELNERAFVKIIRQITEYFVPRLTKAKLAQAVPITGSIVGGSFNAYFTTKICNSAFFIYRERFLEKKYGKEWIKTNIETS